MTKSRMFHLFHRYKMELNAIILFRLNFVGPLLYNFEYNMFGTNNDKDIEMVPCLLLEISIYSKSQ